MKQILLKNTDLKLSNLCLGTGSFGAGIDEKTAFAILDAYTQAGGNFLDTANVYCRWIPGLKNCSEEIIGKWLRQRKAYSQVVVATKGGHYDFQNPAQPRVERKAVQRDLEESLKTLGVDCIDFYWLHRDDPSRPAEEVLEFLEDFRKEGKIRYYGGSNFTLDRLKEYGKAAAAMGAQGFSAVSNQWSLARKNWEADTAGDKTLVAVDQAEYDWHRETGMPLIPFTSTASGFFDKLRAACPQVKDGKLLGSEAELGLPEQVKAFYLNERNLKIYEELASLSRETGHSVFTLSLAYLLNQPFQVIPVSAVSRLEQLSGLLEASELSCGREFAEIYGA